ncbi:MAG: DUF1501 domain-containing protein [Verrucomicrobiales bacterium]|nr:DUF1501 domain-containing protein [Verrucomicrobiales bacterium]
MIDFPSRRQFLHTGLGAGSVALQSLLAAENPATGDPAGPHVRPTAKRVIFLFMSGGPSQVDTFDPKPDLAKLAGKDVPESLAKHVPKIKRAGLKHLLPTPWKFAQHGQSGMPISELMPHTAKLADELCVIRSMEHRNPVHGPGECVALTGTAAGDRPSIGSWSVYGLGSETENLPAFITMNLHSDGMQFPQAAGWGAGFLPPRFQGTVVDPVKGIQNVAVPKGFDNPRRRSQLDTIDFFNRRHLEKLGAHSELEARIQSYEMAFRLQTAAPELFDLDGESKATRDLYGMETSPNKIAGRGCLLARRMIERGVRFVQIRIGGWDAHGNIKGNHERMFGITDKPVAALLTDLKQRGLLDSTLVVWGGEFGRTPTMEGTGGGRDHSPAGYTVWLAGGGVKGGQVIGETDPIGYVVTKRPVSPHDFHATILHALGLKAESLTWNHHGRDEVPTVFGGAPVTEVFG